ncbi:MAG: HAD family phosphatase [Acidobacteriota bacterium]
MRAILFDFNGVLVDDEPIHWKTLQKVLEEEDIPLTEEEYYEKYLGLADRTAFGAILEHFGHGPDPARLARLVARKASYYRTEIREHGFPVFAGAAELVRGAHDAGWMLGVVTGALRDEVESALRQMELLDRFKTLVAAEDVSRGKPDPEGYRKGLQELNSLPPLPERLLHPHEVLVIEDSPAGLRAAGALGLTTVAVTHTYGAERLEGADAVVESLTELTPASIQHRFPS